MTSILLIEDDPGLTRTVTDLLRAEGYDVEHAPDGARALALATSESLDLLLLDLMLPDADGFDICRTLRREGLRTPILMLTARASVDDRVTGLRLGADDYLPKPFDPEELLARIEALLRRTSERVLPRPVRFGDLELDLAGMTLLRNGREVPLKAMEFQLLVYLVQNAGTALSRDRILRDVWGFSRAPATRTVDVHVTWLRRKIEPDRRHPRYLRTVRGVGYKFVGD